mmetsp:Transcript_13266/g.37712  ORF Transcript_13266/g.37712 Transcript_13266/m.37712 type:complete len:215 (+) Transcript_13266:1619-2263(+)
MYPSLGGCSISSSMTGGSVAPADPIEPACWACCTMASLGRTLSQTRNCDILPEKAADGLKQPPTHSCFWPRTREPPEALWVPGAITASTPPWRGLLLLTYPLLLTQKGTLYSPSKYSATLPVLCSQVTAMWCHRSSSHLVSKSIQWSTSRPLPSRLALMCTETEPRVEKLLSSRYPVRWNSVMYLSIRMASSMKMVDAVPLSASGSKPSGATVA